MKAPMSIERNSEHIANRKYDTKICIDRRFNGKPSPQTSLVKISIFRKTALSVELRPDDAIEFFERGIEYARALKASLS